MDLMPYMGLLVTGAIFLIIMGVFNLKRARDE